MFKAALLLIDIQKGFSEKSYWGPRNNPDAEQMAGELLKKWRKLGWPVLHVKHNSTNPDSPLVKGKPGNEIQEVVAPSEDEKVYEKSVNSAFIGTDLEKDLKDQEIQTLIVAGLTTDHCVSTSVRMAGNLGFRVYLVADATATFDKKGPDGKTYPADTMHHVELASIHGEFAHVCTAQQVLSIV